VTDPNLPAELLQSGPTASHDFSCFASTKRPFVISHTRASADVYGDRVGDGTRLTAAFHSFRLLPLNVAGNSTAVACGPCLAGQSERSEPRPCKASANLHPKLPCLIVARGRAALRRGARNPKIQVRDRFLAPATGPRMDGPVRHQITSSLVCETNSQ
jgi:hypothetical protein